MRMPVMVAFLPLMLVGACKGQTAPKATSVVQGTEASCGGSLPEALPKPGEVPSRAMIRETAKVTDSEVAAINRYTSDTIYASIYKEVLQCVRKEDLSNVCMFGPNMLKMAAEFETGVQKIAKTMPFVGVVYRGMLVSEKAAVKLKGLVGKTLGLAEEGGEAYVSSSRSLDFAKNWVKNLERAKQKATLGDSISSWKVVYVIHQCSGASIEGIEPAVRAVTQKEVVLPPSKYRFAAARIAEEILYLTLYEARCAGLGLTDESLSVVATPTAEPAARNFSLAGAVPIVLPCPRPEDKDRYKRSYDDLKKSVDDVKAKQTRYTAASEAAATDSAKVAEQAAARAALVEAQKSAQTASSAFSEAVESLRPVRAVTGELSLVPGVGELLQAAAFAVTIAEAVDIKKQGGSDAKAAAAVLSGLGIAGAVPALLACQDCSPSEKAAAFFSGFFGVDFTGLVVCPGKRCPADDDLAGYADGNSTDWSAKRIKRSCPKGQPVVGTIHKDVEVKTICGRGTPVALDAKSPYHYVENGHQESRWHYPLECGDGEYLAGISFYVGTIYGIKSVLCARPAEPLKGSCVAIRGDSCPQDKFMRGIHVDRAYHDRGKMGVVCYGTLASNGREDDRFEYCDQVSQVTCCNYF